MSALIFSHQRCGSSNLTSFLREAYGIAASSEPFSRKNLSVTLPGWESAPPAALDAHMASVLGERSLVKHIYGHTNEIDESLVDSKHVDRILLLFRENSYAAALSLLIARRVGTFSKVDSETISSISPDEIDKVRRYIGAKRNAAIKICLRSRKPLLILKYEDLFCQDMRERRAWTELIAAFLVRPEARAGRSADAVDAAFEKYMSESGKLNSEDSFSKIENVDELRKAFPKMFATAAAP